MSEYDPQNQYPEQTGNLYRSSSNYSLPCTGTPTPQFNPLYGTPDFSTWQSAAAAAAYASPSSSIRSYYPSAANFISQTAAASGGRFSPSLLNPQTPVTNGHFYSFPDVTGNPMGGLPNGQNFSSLSFNNYSAAASSFRNNSLVTDPTRSLKLGFNDNHEKNKKPHIKKPLNAFMLFMKEMRAKVVAECTLKESAAINQILGRKWHALTREDQAKYYEMARKEKELHHQLYPGWSARDNYAANVKRKKKRAAASGNVTSGANNASKMLNVGQDSQGYSLMKKDKSYMMPSAQWFKQAWTGKTSPSFPVNPAYFDGIAAVAASSNSRSLLDPINSNNSGFSPSAAHSGCMTNTSGLPHLMGANTTTSTTTPGSQNMAASMISPSSIAAAVAGMPPPGLVVPSNSVGSLGPPPGSNSGSDLMVVDPYTAQHYGGLLRHHHQWGMNPSSVPPSSQSSAAMAAAGLMISNQLHHQHSPTHNTSNSVSPPPSSTNSSTPNNNSTSAAAVAASILSLPPPQATHQLHNSTSSSNNSNNQSLHSHTIIDLS